MKALCISDLHGEEITIQWLEKLHSKYNFNLLLFTGDFESPTLAENLLLKCKELKIKTVSVFGNNDSQNVIDIMSRGSTMIHRRTVDGKEISKDLKEFKFSGWGGCPITWGTVQEYSENEIELILSAIEMDGKIIVLSHSPPFGVFDERNGRYYGSKAFRKAVEERQPKLVLCGHMHEYAGVEFIGKTKIIKIPTFMSGVAVLLDLKTLKEEFVRI